MPFLVIAFLAGVGLLQTFAELPAADWCQGLIPVVFGCFLVRSLRPVLAVVAGFLWALLFAHVQLADRLSPEFDGRNFDVVGWPADIPDRGERSTRFLFRIDRAWLDGEPVEVPSLVRLSWYAREVPVLHVGDPWRLRVLLRRPSGFMNAAGFDYEGWLFRQGIGATGYVRDAAENGPVAAGDLCCRVNRWRQRLAAGIGDALGADNRNAGIVAALAVGHRADIPQDSWDLLVDTGTNHLMAVSGLHVGLVAGLAGGLIATAWRRSSRLCLAWPSQRVGALAGLVAAFAYALLAGFAIPTQRALVMVGVVAGAFLFGRAIRPARTLSLALVAVLLIDPLAVLSPGFWLSFAAVAAILWWLAGNRATGARGIGGLVRLQFAIALALFPLTTWFFQQGVVVAPLANLIAVPWVGFTVVPPTLAGTLLLPVVPTVGNWLLAAADWALIPLWPILEGLSALPYAKIALPQPPPILLLSAVAGTFLLLAPRGLPGRLLAPLLILPLLLHTPERPRPGDFSLTLLDVGQGLAAVVETAGQTVLYDTGPPLGERLDAGEGVVRPHLAARGTGRVDRLVISHAGADHAGGLESLRQAVDVTHLMANGIDGAEPCRDGTGWEADGVRFTILHPPPFWDDGNDASCTLRVEGAGGSLLLTGDIESLGEAAMTQRHGKELASDVLLVAHHGSRTSSTARLLDAVSPRWALVSVGHRSRFGHPHREVLERLAARGIEVRRTDEEGAITVYFRAEDGVAVPPGHRLAGRRYWHRRGAED